jgi:hypothetical protein
MVDKKSNAQLKLVTDSTAENLGSSDWKEVRRDRLINSLNRINFQDGEVVINFRHSKYNTFASLPAKPQPCLDLDCECQWSAPTEFDQKFKDYIFENLYFSDGLKQVFIESDTVSIDQNGIRFTLPETAVEICSRKVRRHKCCNIDVQLSQDGVFIEGVLKRFSAVSFSVHVPNSYRNILKGINKESPFNIILKNEFDIMYSGSCEIYRFSSNSEGATIVLKPLKSQIQRYKAKKFRSIRQKLLPMPSITFTHPLIGEKINLTAIDISGSGFSVDEEVKNSTLMPGLIIPELSIELMNSVELKCSAQIMYRSIGDAGKVRCGFTLLDINLKDQISLSSLLHQAKNKNSYVSTKIDVNKLWDFFFETGFIYPKKYSLINKNKKEFRKLYEKLYETNPDFAINFIYKDRGEIIAHMAMFRFFERTWLINHHAANSAKRSRAGLVVLEQISRYINESHQFYSTFMDYVACYFRPENKFPNLVFGGVARSAKDFKKCSIDRFAYMPINKEDLGGSLSNKWCLTNAGIADIKALEFYYENESSGLALQALDLTPSKFNNNELNELYHGYGFKKDRKVFSLKYQDELVAVFIANISDIGMNMSDLTNCIKIFILESDNLPLEEFFAALNEISGIYESNNIPLMIYPPDYAENNSLSKSKIYNFWVLDVQNIGDIYYNHLEKLLRFSK